MKYGTLFDIKEFSIHDGPGTRITVFLKGCPLRCVWCHNPEGLSPKPQLMVKENLCTHCGICRKPCTHEDCQALGRCIHACANGCLIVSGTQISSQELSQKLAKYADFIKLTNGGITISGGEPMLQADFVCELADRLDGIHLALQTSGFADLQTYKKVISKFDFIMQDIKLADEQSHIKYTGVSNKNILKNIEYLKSSGKDFIFRIPLIPDITDTADNLAACAQIAEDFPVELLKYNALAGAKYEMLGMHYTLPGCENRIADFTQFFRNAKMA